MFEEVLSAVWHNSSCYVTLTDVRVTWFQAASACAARNGTLASLDVDSTAVKFIRSPFIPIICVWVGLARNYLYWAMPESQFTEFVYGLIVVVISSSLSPSSSAASELILEWGTGEARPEEPRAGWVFYLGEGPPSPPARGSGGALFLLFSMCHFAVKSCR